MRERGLKLQKRSVFQGFAEVAPRAGAWIETYSYSVALLRRYVVAPRAGAWIETIGKTTEVLNDVVAPRAGAWIETCPTLQSG